MKTSFCMNANFMKFFVKGIKILVLKHFDIVYECVKCMVGDWCDK
jgi:hypothetical protein